MSDAISQAGTLSLILQNCPVGHYIPIDVSGNDGIELKFTWSDYRIFSEKENLQPGVAKTNCARVKFSIWRPIPQTFSSDRPKMMLVI